MRTNAINIQNNLASIDYNYVDLIRELQYWKSKYQELKAELSGYMSSPINSVWVKDRGVSRKIPIDDIILMEADSNYTIIHTTEGRKILSSHTLKSWIAEVAHIPDLIRVHRSYLVNKRHIITYNSSRREISLKNNLMVPVPRKCPVFSELKSLKTF